MKTRDMIGSFFRDVINHLDEQATNDLKKYLNNSQSYLVEHFLEEHQVTHFLRDAWGNTYLHLCMASHLPKKILPLLQRGLDIHAVNDGGDTPLHSGCQSYNFNNLKTLLKHGADINAHNLRGDTPLHTAVRFQRQGIIKFLLENGADKSLKNHRAQNPLESAVELEFYELAEILK